MSGRADPNRAGGSSRVARKLMRPPTAEMAKVKLFRPQGAEFRLIARNDSGLFFSDPSGKILVQFGAVGEGDYDTRLSKSSLQFHPGFCRKGPVCPCH